ncbi:hypothetical protein SNEBB_003325 [Seison nebaliae]|nr:hypothetical protein SNEBB_003325 [Seison nebaliae]
MCYEKRIKFALNGEAYLETTKQSLFSILCVSRSNIRTKPVKYVQFDSHNRLSVPQRYEYSVINLKDLGSTSTHFLRHRITYRSNDPIILRSGKYIKYFKIPRQSGSNCLLNAVVKYRRNMVTSCNKKKQLFPCRNTKLEPDFKDYVIITKPRKYFDYEELSERDRDKRIFNETTTPTIINYPKKYEECVATLVETKIRFYILRRPNETAIDEIIVRSTIERVAEMNPPEDDDNKVIQRFSVEWVQLKSNSFLTYDKLNVDIEDAYYRDYYRPGYGSSTYRLNDKILIGTVSSLNDTRNESSYEISFNETYPRWVYVREQTEQTEYDEDESRYRRHTSDESEIYRNNRWKVMNPTVVEADEDENSTMNIDFHFRMNQIIGFKMFFANKSLNCNILQTMVYEVMDFLLPFNNQFAASPNAIKNNSVDWFSISWLEEQYPEFEGKQLWFSELGKKNLMCSSFNQHVNLFLAYVQVGKIFQLRGKIVYVSAKWRKDYSSVRVVCDDDYPSPFVCYIQVYITVTYLDMTEVSPFDGRNIKSSDNFQAASMEFSSDFLHPFYPKRRTRSRWHRIFNSFGFFIKNSGNMLRKNYSIILLTFFIIKKI